MPQSQRQEVDQLSTRTDYALQICQSLEKAKLALQAEFAQPDQIQTFCLDDVLAPENAKEIYDAFPTEQDLWFLNTIRGQKYVGLQLDRFTPILEEITYAFQDPRVVALISEITGIEPLLPDEFLYAGGISAMTQGNCINPHLDNSHDKERQHYRVLNLLYYISPDWKPEYGGNLELWDHGLKQPCRTIPYRFNRLAVMATHRNSWHSVSRVNHTQRRCCISNYYFSPKCPESQDYTHVAWYRGRPEQPVLDAVLQGDALVRNYLPDSLKNLIKKPGYYQK
jgi:Rps23 Pro-64 3,4-dihydroxylase Tpa1-like proline 4-hydroxylase